jgi:hypothetical protein
MTVFIQNKIDRQKKELELLQLVLKKVSEIQEKKTNNNEEEQLLDLDEQLANL